MTNNAIRYHTTDTMIATTAMNKFLQSREGNTADLWEMVVQDILQPLKVQSGAWTSVRHMRNLPRTATVRRLEMYLTLCVFVFLFGKGKGTEKKYHFSCREHADQVSCCSDSQIKCSATRIFTSLFFFPIPFSSARC